MAKLSDKLQNIVSGDSFDNEALLQAYNLGHTLTYNDRRMLRRYMHGLETSSDRFALQDLVIELANIGY